MKPKSNLFVAFSLSINLLGLENYEIIPLFSNAENLSPEDVQLRIIANEPYVYPFSMGTISTKEYESLYDESFAPNLLSSINSIRLFPNGVGTVTIPVTVADRNSRPVPGVSVAFRVEAVNPSGNGWRTEDGVVARFGSRSRAKARRRI